MRSLYELQAIKRALTDQNRYFTSLGYQQPVEKTHSVAVVRSFENFIYDEDIPNIAELLIKIASNAQLFERCVSIVDNAIKAYATAPMLAFETKLKSELQAINSSNFDLWRHIVRSVIHTLEPTVTFDVPSHSAYQERLSNQEIVSSLQAIPPHYINEVLVNVSFSGSALQKMTIIEFLVIDTDHAAVEPLLRKLNILIELTKDLNYATIIPGKILRIIRLSNTTLVRDSVQALTMKSARARLMSQILLAHAQETKRTKEYIFSFISGVSLCKDKSSPAMLLLQAPVILRKIGEFAVEALPIMDPEGDFSICRQCFDDLSNAVSMDDLIAKLHVLREQYKLIMESDEIEKPLHRYIEGNYAKIRQVLISKLKVRLPERINNHMATYRGSLVSSPIVVDTKKLSFKALIDVIISMNSDEPSSKVRKSCC